MKKFTFFLFIVIVPIIAKTQTTTQTVSTSTTISDYYGPPDLDFSIPKFNSGLGTLISANIIITLSNVGEENDFEIENTSLTSSATFRAKKTLFYTMYIPPTINGSVTQSTTDLPVNSFTVTISPYDGILDYAGTSGYIHPDNTLDSQFMYVGNTPSFIGNGTDSIVVLSIDDFEQSSSVFGSAANNRLLIHSNYIITASVTYTFTPMVLPLTLVFFNATYAGNNTVILNWQTVNEQDIKYFTVEYSRDGQLFLPASQLTAEGNATKNLYTYSDTKNNTNGETVYYRLKYVEENGSIGYSDIAKATMENTVAGNYTLYPNPVIGTPSILQISGKLMSGYYSVCSITGQLLSCKYYTTQNQNITIDIQSLKAGAYILKTPDNKALQFYVQ